MGAGERKPRPPASKALIRGVALIAVAVVIGVALLSAADPFTVASDGERRVTTTTSRPAGTGDDPDDPDGDPDDDAAELRDPGEYTVVVANGSGVAQAAARFSARVSEGGFQAAPPTNAERVETSVLYAVDGFEREAAEVAALLDPIPAIEPMPEPPPVDDLAGASLLLVVGPDLAETPE